MGGVCVTNKAGTDFRMRLLARERLTGTVVTVPSPKVAEKLLHGSFDWLFNDAEHSPLGPLNCQELIQVGADAVPAVAWFFLFRTMA